MIDFNAVSLTQIAVHQVGNKSKDEALRLSVAAVDELDDELTVLLKKHLLEPFNKLNEQFQFTHSSELALNEMFTYCRDIFENSALHFPRSQDIAKHLFEKSLHPKIQSGELTICLFDAVNFEGKDHKAIGIYKSENKDEFIQFIRTKENFNIESQEGINVEKIEKGCLIFDTNPEQGYKLLIIDSQRSGDAHYWKNEFLKVSPCADSYHFTQNFLSVARDYVTGNFPEEFAVGKADQIDLLNRSVEYFKSHESFDKKHFEQEVFHHENIIESFRRFEDTHRKEQNLDIEDQFQISIQAVKKQARVFKSVLKLDRNFHIYIHGNRELIEQGTDPDGRKFYKIFYDQEA